jgi:inosine-uridine nucleoside N-ribohydrolase
VNAPLPVVLDVDTGVDDACALLLAAAHEALDLRAVTCVGGNASLEDVVANTLTVLDAAERQDVPVAAGAARPLLEPAREARHVHGQDGMGDLDWPRSERAPDARFATELLRDVLREAALGGPDALVTLVPLAPMTNIALLLRSYPDVVAGLREIVFMGGAAAVGNATASAEFNVWHDPEAAAIVLEVAAEAALPVTMYGLDVFYDVQVTSGQGEALMAYGRVSGSRAAELAGALIGFQCRRMGSPHATIGDAGAVCAVIDRAGLTTERLPVGVELGGAYSRGRTVVDRRPRDADLPLPAQDPSRPAATDVDVALRVDAERYARLWIDTVGRPGMGR